MFRMQWDALGVFKRGAWAVERFRFAGQDPPAALLRYSRNRSGAHAVEHLRGFTGILQADAYAGYNPFYTLGRVPGPVTEALCWAHGRRKFYELADIAASKRRGKGAAPIAPLALEAVKRIDALFDNRRNPEDIRQDSLGINPDPGLPLASPSHAMTWRATDVFDIRPRVHGSHRPSPLQSDHP